jgi:hypothetical protein
MGVGLSNMPTFTTGTFTASTPVVSGGSRPDRRCSSAAWALCAEGRRRFTIDGVYGVNPISYVNTTILQQFTLTADLRLEHGTLSISPSIIADTNSQLQTVNALPANGAHHLPRRHRHRGRRRWRRRGLKQNLIANPAAFAFVSADLPVKLAGAVAGRTPARRRTGSIRYVDQYNIQTDQMPRRMDMLVGAAPILPYFARSVGIWG